MNGRDRKPTRAVAKVTQAAGGAGSPTEALAALNNVIEAAREYFRLRQQHHGKSGTARRVPGVGDRARAGRRARLDVLLR